MKIQYGLMSNSVLCRDETGVCNIVFAAQVTGDLRVSAGMLTKIGDEGDTGVFRLQGIPFGGPYTLTLRDDDSTLTLNDLYVGDVWLLAGQSNMEGVGYYRDIAEEVTYEKPVFHFKMEESGWVKAEPMMHELFRSPHPYLRRYVPYFEFLPRERGVGPGYFIAHEMHARTGVPQGVIPCALGGSALVQWDPDVTDPEGNLYTIALHRAKLCGGNVRGIFWYQGCSETHPEGVEKFDERMMCMIQAFREAFASPSLPFVQVQIGKHVNCPIEGDAIWSAVREKQRLLGEKIAHLDTLSVAGSTLSDGIHLDTTSQKKLGKAMAESMFHMVFDPHGQTSKPAPKLKAIFAHAIPTVGSVLAVQFENIHGALQSKGAPTGFALSTRPDTIDRRGIYRVVLGEDTVFLHHELPFEELKKCYLSYYFGNGSEATITDAAERPIPAFGPLFLGDIL